MLKTIPKRSIFIAEFKTQIKLDKNIGCIMLVSKKNLIYFLINVKVVYHI